MIIHCERFDEYNSVDLQYAFSTKISDSIMSQKPFFLYAPANLSETKYMKNIDSNFVACSKIELTKKLDLIISGNLKYNPNLIKANKDFSFKANKIKLYKMINAKTKDKSKVVL